MSPLQAYIVFQFELVPKWSIMIHAHNLPVYYPGLFCSRWYFNHIGAWFKRDNKTNGEADFNSFHFSFDSTARYIWVFVFRACVCVCCESASSVLRHSRPRKRHRHDRQWNVIRLQPSHSEFFNTGKKPSGSVCLCGFTRPQVVHMWIT